jgi:hypothetical protein
MIGAGAGVGNFGVCGTGELNKNPIRDATREVALLFERVSSFRWPSSMLNPVGSE